MRLRGGRLGCRVRMPAGAVGVWRRGKGTPFLDFDFHAGNFAKFKRAGHDDPIERRQSDAAPPGGLPFQTLIGTHDAQAPLVRRGGRVMAVGRGKLFILLPRRPAANFLAILVDEPHGFRADLSRRAIDDNLSASWMLGAIKAPDPNVGQTTEVVNILFGRPKWKPFEDFGTGAARRPDILDKAISQWRLHGFSSPFECHLIREE
jgi:hypothetical protein